MLEIHTANTATKIAIDGISIVATKRKYNFYRYYLNYNNYSTSTATTRLQKIQFLLPRQFLLSPDFASASPNSEVAFLIDLSKRLVLL